MAFFYAADAQGIMRVVGHFLQFVEGSAVLAGGTATVTVSQAFTVKSAFVSSQTSNAARVSATASNTFTITGLTCSAAPNAAGLTNAHVSEVAYNNVSASTAQIADRLRTILHLILTSPDFTIQR